MSKLLDRAFWNFLSGFVLILIVSVSLLTVFGAYQKTRETVAALVQGFKNMEGTLR